MDPTTMDLTQIRDWAARRQGWTETTPAMCDDQPVPLGAQWHQPTRSGSPGSLTWCIHPIPSTLDAIAGLMPPDWIWEKTRALMGERASWRATHPKYHYYLAEHLRVSILDTGNELLDRARLAMLATLAEDRNKEPRP
jgi:hypothetical protein